MKNYFISISIFLLVTIGVISSIFLFKNMVKIHEFTEPYEHTDSSLHFNYPREWNVIYDQKPDPIYNPTKHAITLSNNESRLDVTIFKSDQLETFESLLNISNLPSGPAQIISKKKINSQGLQMVYIEQNNDKVGIMLMSPNHHVIIFETDSKNKILIDGILSTIHF